MKLLVIPYIVSVLFFLLVRLSSVMTKKTMDLKIYFEQRLFVVSSIFLLLVNTVMVVYTATNDKEFDYILQLAIVCFISAEVGKALSYKDSKYFESELSYDEIIEGNFEIREIKTFSLFGIYWYFFTCICAASLFYICYSFMSSMVGVIASSSLYILLDAVMYVDVIKTYNGIRNKEPSDAFKYDSNGNPLQKG